VAGAGAAGGGLAGELLLVQGMVDCLVDLPEGPVLLDFKTDRVTAEQLAARSRMYFPQVALYARAVRESLDTQVREAWLVFLHPRACVRAPVG
jgi:ATP-dependent helicase/nuclease subunit A